MNIGFGIFGGLVVLGIIYLYTQTKDRWNWSKIAKRALIAIAAMIVVPIAIIYGYIAVTEYLSNQPKKITNYGGLTIGEKLADVEFRSVLEEVKKNDEAKKEVGKTFRRFQVKDTNLLFDVEKDSDTVDSIIIDCQTKDLDSINGVACWNTSEKIFEKYGKNNIQVFCKKPDPKDPDTKQIRLYEAKKYFVTYGMHLNQVRAIFIKSLKSPSQSESWDLCDKQ